MHDSMNVKKTIKIVITLYGVILLNVRHIQKSPDIFQQLHYNYIVQLLEYIW
jgi:hypothetical protein